MTDLLSEEQRSLRMALIKSKNSKPEVRLRKLIYSLGYRYRLHVPELPGKPDIVFPGRKKVIFMHGCFWHRHSTQRCRLTRLPKSRLEYWRPKLEANHQRDIRNRRRLKGLGWQSLVIWECEMANLEMISRRVAAFLE